MENIPHILKHGIAHRSSNRANPNYVTIGDVSLINTRDKKRVYVDNGDAPTRDTPRITLGDLIPFYFGIRMPMLYVIQNGGNFVSQPTKPEDIVYLVCSVARIHEWGLTCYFSDGHGTDSLTNFYDQFDQLPTVIDWNAVKQSFWGGAENLDLKRKKQAEFLVADDLPPSTIIGFGCYNQATRKRLVAIGVDETKIKLLPNAYY